MLTFDDFTKRLKEGNYSNVTGARRAVGKMASWSKADHQRAQAAVNKHFGVVDGEPTKAPKAAAASKPAKPAKVAKVAKKAAKKAVVAEKPAKETAAAESAAPDLSRRKKKAAKKTGAKAAKKSFAADTEPETTVPEAAVLKTAGTHYDIAFAEKVVHTTAAIKHAMGSNVPSSSQVIFDELLQRTLQYLSNAVSSRLPVSGSETAVPLGPNESPDAARLLAQVAKNLPPDLGPPKLVSTPAPIQPPPINSVVPSAPVPAAPTYPVMPPPVQ